jgi:methylglutaconyl-CoA hydratase
MSDVLSEIQGSILLITLNRVEKHNAFDDILLTDLLNILKQAEDNDQLRAIVLKANGRHFSAGADLAWMQRMAAFSEEENISDAQILADLMSTLYHSKKPTIAMVHGASMGGGVGLVAACDIAIAADTAQFCFSEVKLGLIPAVISPYVIKAIGERAALELFMSAEVFDAKRAQALHLVQHVVSEQELLSYTLHYAEQIAQWPPQTVVAIKSLVEQVASKPIDKELELLTAKLIAKQRASSEGQQGLRAFLNRAKK